MSDDLSAERARKERSPSFPFVPLKKAVERAQAMATAHKRSHTRIATVGETWGYGPKSSGLLQTVAALKAYGLIEDMGGRDDRRIQLSDLAYRILHDSRQGARQQAIKEAALNPKLIAEYAALWVPERPNDNHCVSELHLDRGFTAEAAKLFLRVFDDTVSYANLGSGDDLSQSPVSSEDEPSQPDSPVASVFERMAPPPERPRHDPFGAFGNRHQPAPGYPRATLPLPEGTAAVEIPSGLSRKSHRAVKQWLELMVSLAARELDESGDPPQSN